MKQSKYFLLLLSLTLLSCQLFAAGTDSLTEEKQCFVRARQELIKMLDGRQPLSYERAIFIIENAYVNEKMNYNLFEEAIDGYAKNVQYVINTNKSVLNTKFDPPIAQRAMYSPEQFAKANKDLLANWAIFSIMHDKIIPVRNDKGILLRVVNNPYTYSYGDPLGTKNWRNTQVSNLLATHRGNCFALASLYKILANRFKTDAVLCTAPNHIFISHRDEYGREFNVELSNGSFPGSGTMGTLTYTTNDAIDNNIALRQLDEKQSVALCLTYLAKGYQYKFGIEADSFMMNCAESAISYDAKSLNAMLLKAEILEYNIIKTKQPVQKLQSSKDFIAYQKLIGELCSLGYREMPVDMKNKLIKGWSKDSVTKITYTNYNPATFNHSGVSNTRYASLSWGFFDEEIPYKPIEQFGSTLYDVKSKKITRFTEKPILYNNYIFDPVAFALNVDPLAHKFPWQSPYCAMDNNPILKCDPTGASGVATIKGDVIIIHSTNVYYGTGVTTKLAKQDAKDIEATWNAANAVKVINGKEYKVQFKITPQVMSVKDGEAARKTNTDIETNYIAVGRYGANTNTNTHSVSDDNRNLGGNDFDYNQQDFASGNKSSSHEQGHGWGWFDFTVNGDPFFDKGSGHNDKRNPNGSPNIMQDRNNVDESEWGDRKATQQDVDKLNINWQELGDKGKTNVGDISDHTQ